MAVGRCRTTRRTEPTTCAPNLREPVAQPRHLGAGTGGARRAQPEFLHQHVGGGGEEHAQLIGPEATAARAVDLQAIEQLLDPIFDVAAGAVDPFIEEARRLAQIGHDEARVVARLAVAEPDDLGLDHDAAVRGPTRGPDSGCRRRPARSGRWPRSGPAPRAGRARRGAATRRSWPSPPRSRAAARHPGSRRSPVSQSHRRAARETAPGERPAAAGAAAGTTRPRSRGWPAHFRAAAPPRTDTVRVPCRRSETPATAGSTSYRSAR